MAADIQIRKAAWSGQVPICIKLALNEIAAVEKPLPLYIMLSRLSYFPQVFDRLKSHFLGVAPSALDEIWLDFNGTPLKWHLPVGVLFDLCGSSVPLPWQVTVHFTGFPEDKLLRMPGLEALKTTFMSILKEANCLKYGDGAKVMSLSRQDQDNLWLGITAGEGGFQQFWDSNEKLLGDCSTLKSCALRVLSAQKGQMVQLPVKPLQQDGSQTSLGQALAQFGFPANAQALIQGIVVPPEASVFGLMGTLACCDGFVYAIVQ